MNDEVLSAWSSARAERRLCALVTVAATKGSVPREAGAKMLVMADRFVIGTIGGGKFEALVVDEAVAAIERGKVTMKSYPLHENAPAAFGAICGGEVTVLIEPECRGHALTLIGAGHCAQAIATLARSCEFHVNVVDDRAEWMADFPADSGAFHCSPQEFIASRQWRSNDALVLVSRNFEMDRDALEVAMQQEKLGYLGMIGSRKKVAHVMSELAAKGVAPERFSNVYAPIGLDIGADSPMEIAVSVLAEILQVLRQRQGGHLGAKLHQV